MGVSSRSWGKTPFGKEVMLFTLENSAGCKARISTYGGTLTGLEIPVDGTVSGKMLDVVLGFDSLQEYAADGNYMGATVGRVAGRISNASFELNGQKFQLDSNEGPNHLHGGRNGFNRQVWEVAAVGDKQDTPSLTLSLLSLHLEGGYPGNLKVEATFTLSGTSLRIIYRATSDQPTPLNITAHPYFNLNGNGRKINNHQLKIFSTKSTTFDEALIPDGKIVEISGTEADFIDFTPLGTNEQDRFYVLENEREELIPAAIARCEESGLELEVCTNQLGVQLYTADGIANESPGKNGIQYGPRCGFCIEPMGYPDAVNKPEFPSVILRPGEKYNHSTEYRFRRIS
ncbi:aldose epimerase family protein [Desulfovibrio sp. JC022]|uniref:aldose epimerase family protein n=1 Tax=Desulfovibrio sp. JC022 TaxID=2593642 RepID=UPI0013D3006C|nr:aldose epimerase family protein [Desulfovibrio sp. JC022]NDV23274.1 galactose mutarotase [Desulfovibrio sp. JC022]